jgi:8-oxo-dGTP diphosphatase
VPVSDQGLPRDRYSLVPRTAVFLRREDSFLLLKGAASKRLWAGKYNCLGGHIERGEDVLSAANRELREETGLQASLWLAGLVIVDAGPVGVCLYVFAGVSLAGDPLGSSEGAAEWIPFSRIEDLPVVEDLPILISRIRSMKPGDAPFSARSFYDSQDRLQMIFTE